MRTELATTPNNCTVCGSAVFCGGTICPSSFLPVGPDGVPMVDEELTLPE